MEIYITINYFNYIKCNLNNEQYYKYYKLKTQSLILEDLDFTELYTETANIYQNQTQVGKLEILYNYTSALTTINLNNKPQIKVAVPYSLL